jgi:hypothetical protein
MKASTPYRQSQVAATLLQALGFHAADFSTRADEPLAIFERNAN